MEQQIRTAALFDFSRTLAGDFLQKQTYPWEALPHIGTLIKEIGVTLSPDEYDHPSEEVWIAKSAKIAPTALIEGAVIIGPDTEVRHCAYIRGNALIGAGAVVGNSTEIKNAILFDGVQVPHFNYVGDSILGYRAHLGGGALLSNVRSDHGDITVRGKGFAIPTGMRKVGAMIGDEGEIGAGAVLNPGTVIGRRSIVYPLVAVRGVVPAAHIFKKQGDVVPRL